MNWQEKANILKEVISEVYDGNIEIGTEYLESEKTICGLFITLGQIEIERETRGPTLKRYRFVLTLIVEEGETNAINKLAEICDYLCTKPGNVVYVEGSVVVTSPQLPVPCAQALVTLISHD